MKKFISLVIALLMCLSVAFVFVGCNDSSSDGGKTNNNDSNISSLDSFEEIEAALTKDVDNTISSLTSEWEELKSKIDTYDKYSKETDKIEAFYNKVLTETAQLCNRLYSYSLRYTQVILSSNKSCDDMYDDFDEVYDNVYDDAGDKIYDEIYDGILDDMYDALYDGVLDDAYDTIPYSEWSDARSNEYDWWSDARSDVYDMWSDTRSDIYDFWSDMRSDLWNDDIDDAKDRMSDFEEDISKISK